MANFLLLVFAFAGLYNVWAAFSETIYSFWHLVGGVLLLLFPCAFMVLIALSMRNARRMNRRLLESSESDIAAIYRAIGEISDEPSTVFRLGRTGLKSKHDEMYIPIIGSGALSAWAGKQVTLEVGTGEIYSFKLEPCQDLKFASLQGEKYALVGIPRSKMAGGKQQNKFQYDYYLQKSESLKELISRTFPKSKPVRVLEFLFETYGKNGDFLGFGGCTIGGYPRWIQEPAFPDCPECNRRMQHLVEIGSNKAAWNRRVGQSYIFSCKAHPQEIQIVTQWD